MYWNLLPWLNGAVMVSLAVAWLLLALAFGDWRAHRSGTTTE
jgi:hypothetical protein